MSTVRTIAVSLPARINVLGSPTDAVEGAYATVSAAVPVRGGASIAPGDGLTFARADGGGAIFAVSPPGVEDRLADALRAAATSAGLTGSDVLVLPVTATGLQVSATNEATP